MIKKKIHIDMIKLHEDMLQKREQVPEDIDDFLKIIQKAQTKSPYPGKNISFADFSFVFFDRRIF